MANDSILDRVKNALGITDDYQDDTLTEYVNEVIDFLKEAGVKEQNITIGVITRGVADLWSYGANDGKLSSYFIQRASQLALK